MVEVEGVEPTSETDSSPTSTSVVCYLKFPSENLNKRSFPKSSFMNTRKPQSFDFRVGAFYLPLRKARITDAHTNKARVTLWGTQARLGSLECYVIVSV